MTESPKFDAKHPVLFARNVLETKGYFTGSALTKAFVEEAGLKRNEARDAATSVTRAIIAALKPDGIVANDIKGLHLGKTQRRSTYDDTSTPDIYFNADLYTADDVQELYAQAEIDRKIEDEAKEKERAEEQKRLAQESRQPSRISLSLVAIRAGLSIGEIQDYLATAEESAESKHIRRFEKSLDQNQYASVAKEMISEIDAVDILQHGISAEELTKKITEVRTRLIQQSQSLDQYARYASDEIIKNVEEFSTTRRGLHFFTPVLLLRPFVPLVETYINQQKSTHQIISDVLISDSYPPHFTLPEQVLLGWLQREDTNAKPENILTDELIARGIFADVLRVGFLDRSFEEGSSAELNAISLAYIAEKCSFDDIANALSSNPFSDITDATLQVTKQKEIADIAWKAVRGAKPKDKKSLEAEAKRQQNAIAPLNARLNHQKITNQHSVHAKVFVLAGAVVENMIKAENMTDELLAQAANAKELYDLLYPYFVDNELEFMRSLRATLTDAINAAK